MPFVKGHEKVPGSGRQKGQETKASTRTKVQGDMVWAYENMGKKKEELPENVSEERKGWWMEAQENRSKFLAQVAALDQKKDLAVEEKVDGSVGMVERLIVEFEGVDVPAVLEGR